MQELALAVERREVRLVGYDGSASRAVITLARTGSRGAGPETLLERLNAPRADFLPCEIEGEMALINLSWIAYLEVAGDALDSAARERRGARRAPVSVDLVSGETLEGEIQFEPAPGRERVLDALTGGDGPFVPLLGESGVRYLRKSAVLRARG